MSGRRARVVALVAGTWLFGCVGVSESAVPTAVSIAPSRLPSGTVGSAYGQSVTVSGPNPPYTVRVTQGSLPSRLSLSLRGALRGMPTVPGSFAITISAFDSNGTYVAFRDYVVTVSKCSGRRGNAYFADDFESGLGKWNLWGHANAFTLVRGRKGHGASITVGPSTTGPISSGSEQASLWLDWPTAHASSGDDTWYAAKVRFPTGYQATTGQWNWFMEWHVDEATGNYPGGYSSALGVFTDYPVTSQPGRNPRIAFRVMGGSVTSPQEYKFTMRANSLRRGWWYDVVVHFVWSADARIGLAELWLDHKLVVSRRFPTLYRHPSGASSINTFGLYNYRPKASWNASIHFDRVRIGPTKASVG
jgi:hypothetical protein